jgi:sugar lactone lactonase YvrE
MDIAVAPDGTVYLSAWHNHKIESYDPATGEVRIVAGQQSPGGVMMGMTTTPDEGGPAGAAKLNFPSSIVIDGSGALLVADQRTNRIRRIAPDGERIITTFAGVAGPPGFDGDAGPASAAHLALSPRDEAAGSDNPPPGGAIALDGAGNLYVADTYNHCVRSIAPGSDGALGTGDPAEEIIVTIAGRCMESGYTGDGDLANAAALTLPFDLEVGPDGMLYIADTGNSAVRRVDLTAGTIETVAGTGAAGISIDGLPADETKLSQPYGLAFDAEGTLFIADTMSNRIRMLVR